MTVAPLALESEQPHPFLPRGGVGQVHSGTSAPATLPVLVTVNGLMAHPRVLSERLLRRLRSIDSIRMPPTVQALMQARGAIAASGCPPPIEAGEVSTDGKVVQRELRTVIEFYA